MMKHRMSNRLALAACVACALVACMLAFGATLAQADVDSGLGGANELLVSVSVNEQDPDVQKADATVSLYRVATGSKNADYDTYDYTFDVDAFKSISEGYDLATMTNYSWHSMAEAASLIVRDQEIPADATAKMGEKISGLADGIYLVRVSNATTEQYTYSFTPALVALPGKVDADGAPTYNTSSGRWTNTEPMVPVPVTVKWSQSPRYGSLRIDKTVTGFKGEAATFVYHIVDAKTHGKVYENFAAVQYTAEGTQSTTVGHIPAKLELLVTEEYTGARYKLASPNDQTITITADEIVSVAFVNEPDDSGTGGHGIENHFVFDYRQGDWQLDVRAIDASENVSSS